MTQTLKQKLKDKRFRENERKLLRLFFEYGDSITIERMAKKIGVGRATIYRHHKTVRGIIDDYIEMFTDECESFRNVNIQKYYYNVLIFVLKNWEMFLIFLRFHDRQVLLVMLSKNKDNLARKQKKKK